MVGQEHVTDPLSIALDTGRISHAYLFSGPRGCGKTSSARILARSLNCVQGPTSRPCGVCPSCVALGPGGPGNLDVIELDAASHGGVDDTRELRDRAFYAPAESRYRVFIVDEAHMVTTAGFNALLKIVEEPPAHLIFIFATTEPDKVLPTIRSRTHHYPFRLLPPATMRGLLGKICEQEQVPVEEAVYPLVIRAGGGSPRDSLSVLDQLLAGAGAEGVTYPRAVSLLGVTDVALIDDAIDALAAGDGAALFGTIDQVMEAGHDPRRFAVDLLERLRDLILLRAVPDAADRGLVSGPGDVLERMRDQAQRVGPATLARHAELLHEGLGEMRGATAPRLLLEIVCARMLLPSVSEAESATLQRIEQLERGIASGAAPASRPAAAPTSTAPAQDAPSGAPRRRGAELLAAARRETRAASEGGAQSNAAPDRNSDSGSGAAPTSSAEPAPVRVRAAGADSAAVSERGTGTEPTAAVDPSAVVEPVAGAGSPPVTEREGESSPIGERATQSSPVIAHPVGAEPVGAVDPSAVAERRAGAGASAFAELGAVADASPVVERGAGSESSPVAERRVGGGVSPVAESAAAAESFPVAERGAGAGSSGPAGGRADDAGAVGAVEPPLDADRAEGAGPARSTRSGATVGADSAGNPDVGALDVAGAATESEAAQSGSASSSGEVAAEAGPAASDADLLRAVEAAWGDIRSKVREFGPTVQALLSGASVSRIDGDVIVFAHQHAPLAKRLSDPRNLEAVRAAVRAVLGRDHEVRWEAGASAPRPAAATTAKTRSAAGREPAKAPSREPGPAAGRSTDAAAPPKYSRPSQARGAAVDTAGSAQRPNRAPDTRPRGGDDDIPPPDFPDLPDDPGPTDYAPVDGVPPPTTPEEEQEMLRQSAEPVAPGERRDPDEIALELLVSELGAIRLDG